MYNKKKLTIYLAWAFGLAWTLQIIASYFANQGNAGAFQGIMAVSMFAPLVAVVLSKTGIKTLGWRPIFKGHLGTLFIAWFWPAVLCVLGGALYFVLFPAALDTEMSMMDAQMAVAGAENSGIAMQQIVMLNVLTGLTMGPLINTFAAVGEEAGWRGVMYPMLKERFGTTKGRILGGCIWGAWHWPVMILAGYEYGSSYWGAPLTGMLAFCVFATSAGILLDWVYEKTACIWYPALAHGAINACANLPTLMLNPLYADKLLLGPLMIGLISGIPLLITAVWICLRNKKVSE